MSIASEITRINSNIASAYTSCANKGATMPSTQNSANLADTIDSIYVPLERKDINFYDYDGTLVHSYTFAEASALTALPAQPTHTGLTADGWNWSLEDIVSYAENEYPVNVGSMYDTSDHKTRLYFYVVKGTSLNGINLNICAAANATVTVDWGDGTTDSQENTSGDIQAAVFTKSDYAVASEDEIICVSIQGNHLLVNDASEQYQYYNIFGNSNEISRRLIKAAVGSDGVKISLYAFSDCFNLQTISMPNGTVIEAAYIFQRCYSLKAFCFPNNNDTVAVANYMLYYCSDLSIICFTTKIENIGNAAFAGCQNAIFTLPDSVDYVADNAASAGSRANQTFFPSRLIYIPSWMYHQLDVKTIKIGHRPNGQIMDFTQSYKLEVLDMTAFTNKNSIPSLYSSSAFSDCQPWLVILVANSTMAVAFGTASIWRTYANNIKIKPS